MKATVRRFFKAVGITAAGLVVTLPVWWLPVRFLRLEIHARSVTADEARGLMAAQDRAVQRGFVRLPAITLPSGPSLQRGIVRFPNDTWVSFAFSPHPGTAVFIGPNYHRIVHSEAWCCELETPELADSAALDAWLTALEKKARQ